MAVVIQCNTCPHSNANSRTRAVRPNGHAAFVMQLGRRQLGMPVPDKSAVETAATDAEYSMCFVGCVCPDVYRHRLRGRRRNFGPIDAFTRWIICWNYAPYPYPVMCFGAREIHAHFALMSFTVITWRAASLKG